MDVSGKVEKKVPYSLGLLVGQMLMGLWPFGGGAGGGYGHSLL